VASVHVHHVPVLPELVLAELPPGAHVLIMTHDHAEDVALCDAALRTPGLGSIGLIGSAPKWARFRRRLAEEGHAEDAALCDAALRCTDLGSIGLIGSAAKWSRFRGKLSDLGHTSDAIDRITTPIGLPDLLGKDPATIAVSVAAALVCAFEHDRADAAGVRSTRP